MTDFCIYWFFPLQYNYSIWSGISASENWKVNLNTEVAEMPTARQYKTRERFESSTTGNLKCWNVIFWCVTVTYIPFGKHCGTLLKQFLHSPNSRKLWSFTRILSFLSKYKWTERILFLLWWWRQDWMVKGDNINNKASRIILQASRP